MENLGVQFIFVFNFLFGGSSSVWPFIIMFKADMEKEQIFPHVVILTSRKSTSSFKILNVKQTLTYMSNLMLLNYSVKKKQLCIQIIFKVCIYLNLGHIVMVFFNAVVLHPLHWGYWTEQFEIASVPPKDI